MGAGMRTARSALSPERSGQKNAGETKRPAKKGESWLPAPTDQSRKHVSNCFLRSAHGSSAADVAGLDMGGNSPRAGKG